MSRRFAPPAKLVLAKAGSGNPAGAVREPPLRPACAGLVSRSERDWCRAGLTEGKPSHGFIGAGKYFEKLKPVSSMKAPINRWVMGPGTGEVGRIPCTSRTGVAQDALEVIKNSSHWARS